eukprot:c33012_g1_i1 orf=1-219(-)
MGFTRLVCMCYPQVLVQLARNLCFSSNVYALFVQSYRAILRRYLFLSQFFELLGITELKFVFLYLRYLRRSQL